MIEPQAVAIESNGRPDYIVARYAAYASPGGRRSPVVLIKLFRPAEWSTAGKTQALGELREYMAAWLNHTEFGALYGLCGIGLNWMVCKMEKGGPPAPATLLNWHGDISSASFDAFRMIAELVDSTH